MTAWIFDREHCACPAPAPKVFGTPLGSNAESENPELGQTPFADLKTDARLELLQNVAIGTLVSERYKVSALIGRGEIGVVYRVEQIHIKKMFAMKVLTPKTASNATLARRFKNEALAASKLDHPNLVRAIDYGWLDSGQPFLVMELIEGETLAQYLKREGKISAELAVKIFVPLCLALNEAHKKGIVHRDLKPGNIMLSNAKTGDGESIPKIVDFGIAKSLQDEEPENALTKVGEVFGTPFYMSPEQCLGSEVDCRSDIYSLGCVLYEALTGAPPFLGNPLQIMMQHKTQDPQSLRDASFGLKYSETLESIVRKMLAKAPDERYANCLEVAQDLTLHQSTKPSSLAHQAAIFSQPSPLAVKFLFLLLISSIVIAGTTFGSQLSYLRPQKKAGQVASSRVASASAESTGAASTVPQAPEADDTKLSAALTGPISERFVYETLRSNPRGPLSLQDQRLSRETFKSLSLYPFLAAVELRDCTGLTNEVVKQLSSLPLVELDLSQTDITKKGAKDMIEAAKAWPKTLKILKFNSTEIDDDTCDSLPRLRAMNELVLKNTKITNTSLQKICQLPMLKKLALDNTNISTLENIEKLQSLSELYLSGTQVRMTNLLKLRDLPKLRILKLVHCPQLSSSDLARVREMLPKCQVTTESNGRELDKLRRASELLN